MPAFATSNLKITPDDELATKLSQNVDFQNYVLSNVAIIRKVQETKSSHLFFKLLKKEASLEEKNKFSKILGYANVEDFTEHLGTILKNKELYTKSFPELLKHKNILAINRSAISAIIKQSKFVSLSDCEWMWVALASLCYNTCNLVGGDFMDCWILCMEAADAALMACLMNAN